MFCFHDIRCRTHNTVCPNFEVRVCVMEIEKEVDWLAENILAYERGLRQ